MMGKVLEQGSPGPEARRRGLTQLRGWEGWPRGDGICWRPEGVSRQ